MTNRRGAALGHNQFVEIGDVDYVNAYYTVAASRDKELTDYFASMTVVLHGFPTKVQDTLGKGLKRALKEGAFFEVTDYLHKQLHEDAKGRDATSLTVATEMFMDELLKFRTDRKEPVYHKRKDMPISVKLTNTGCSGSSPPSSRLSH